MHVSIARDQSQVVQKRINVNPSVDTKVENALTMLTENKSRVENLRIKSL